MASLPQPSQLAQVRRPLGEQPLDLVQHGDEAALSVELHRRLPVETTRLGYTAECTCGWFELFISPRLARTAICPVEDELATSRARKQRVLALLVG